VLRSPHAHARVVRLHFYVADDAVTPVVHAALAARFRDAPPAVTIVRSVLVVAGAGLACDAVAAVTRRGDGSEKTGAASGLPAAGSARQSPAPGTGTSGGRP
jgi:hypothetical protein